MKSTKEYPLDSDEQGHSLVLMRSLDLMRKEKQGCDLTIKVDGEEIQVHRAVMSAMSDYFKAMFAHDTLENRSGVVEMKGVGFKFVKKGVDHIYGGKVSISEDGCEEFLIVTTMMQLPLLRDKIARFLARRLNAEKFFEFHRIAEKFHCDSLRDACFEYASENLGAISKEHQFEDLELEYMLSLMQWKNSPYSEDAKCSVLLQWIKYDTENRQCFLTQMMDALNLENLSQNFSRYLVESEPVCFESPECLKSLYVAAADKVKAEGAPVNVPFTGRNNAFVVFDKTSKALQAYHPSTKTWTKMHDLHEDLPDSLGYTAIVNEKILYVLMATRKFLRLNIVDVDSSWEPLSNMLLEHGEHLRAAVLDNFIYVAGGNSMERYSITADGWEKVNSDNVFLNLLSLASCNDCIYAIGGSKDESSYPSDSVKTYSPATSSWSDSSSMPWSRRNVASVVEGNEIFVAGGYSSTTSNSISNKAAFYNNKTDIWASLPIVFFPSRSNISLCFVEEKLFAVAASTTQDIAVYDFETKRWEESAKLGEMQIMAPATVALWLPK